MQESALQDMIFPRTGIPDERALESGVGWLGYGPTRLLEAEAVRAWPTLEEQWRQGCLLRFGGGFLRRANCVVPLGPVVGDPVGLVEACEEEYASRGMDIRFKMLPEVVPAALTAALEGRGYRREADTQVMTRALSRCHPTACSPSVVSLDRQSWAEVYSECADLTSHEHGLLLAMVRKMVMPIRLGALRAGDRFVSCGMAVGRGKRVGVYCVATAPERRNRGHCRELVDDLLIWGRNQGAQVAYLQVGRRNTPAQCLYARLGFRPVYAYHYLTRPHGAVETRASR